MKWDTLGPVVLCFRQGIVSAITRSPFVMRPQTIKLLYFWLRKHADFDLTPSFVQLNANPGCFDIVLG